MVLTHLNGASFAQLLNPPLHLEVFDSAAIFGLNRSDMLQVLIQLVGRQSNDSLGE
jgi:hypothetical protein